MPENVNSAPNRLSDMLRESERLSAEEGRKSQYSPATACGFTAAPGSESDTQLT